MLRLREILRQMGLTDGTERSSQEKREFIEYLRANQTPPERMMARVLLHLGIQADPQVPLLGFVVDFLDREHRTVIEVDGESHLERVTEDAQRDAALAEAGYRVIRIYNEQVVQLMADVAADRAGAA